MENSSQQIAAVLAGNRRAFAGIVDSHKRLVSQIVHRVIKSEADHEDLCQDVFLKVYQNLSKFRMESKLSTWIARIAYNTSLNFIEKKRALLYEDFAPEGETVDSCAGEAITPYAWTEARQFSTSICTEIDRLPPVYGLILSLYHLQDLSYTEISNVMQMPDGTVKSYLFRARKMLKERLESKLQLEGVLCA